MLAARCLTPPLPRRTTTTLFSRSAALCCQLRTMTSNESKPFTNCAQAGEADGSKDFGDAAWKAKLTPAEFNILRLKGTDPRGGRYDDFYGHGTYVCAACEALLYTSEMKYECGCGWPGFWDCVPKTVREEPDADGRRVEILCNACNSHLGHVFRNEGFSNPPPNERHCVNNTSVRFVPA